MLLIGKDLLEPWSWYQSWYQVAGSARHLQAQESCLCPTTLPALCSWHSQDHAETSPLVMPVDLCSSLQSPHIVSTTPPTWFDDLILIQSHLKTLSPPFHNTEPAMATTRPPQPALLIENSSVEKDLRVQWVQWSNGP